MILFAAETAQGASLNLVTIGQFGIALAAIVTAIAAYRKGNTESVKSEADAESNRHINFREDAKELVDQIQEERAETRRELSACRDECAQVRGELAEARSEVTDLTAELALVRRDLTLAQRQVETLTIDNQALHAQITGGTTP